MTTYNKAPLSDITNKTFNRLTVIKEVEPHITPCGTKKRIFLCKCSCGNEKRVERGLLINGFTKSCGCLSLENTIKRSTTHGLKHHPLYSVWQNMKTRCYNPKTWNYKNYGGRGIKVCDEWRNDFKAFYDWAVNDGYSDGLSIDRRNNDGNYEPSNCKWSTAKEQANNRREKAA